MSSRSKGMNNSLCACNDAFEALRKVTKVDLVLQNLDILIERLFIAKAESCNFFDRQLFKDAAKPKRFTKETNSSQRAGICDIRQICLEFVRVVADLARKGKYKREVIPKLIIVIRLEASLFGIAQKDTKQTTHGAERFPVCILEFLIGLILYASEYDDELVESLLNDHILVSPGWIYHTYIALEHIKKGFDTSQQIVYKGTLSDKAFLQRFVAFLIKMPKPQAPIHRFRATVSRKRPPSKIQKLEPQGNIDLDSDSVLEYTDSDESQHSCELGGCVSSKVAATDVKIDKTYSYTAVYSNLWYGAIFGRVPLPNETLAGILKHIPESILPYAHNPAIYANWLMKHLNGNEQRLSVLSLRGIFELILKYGLGEVEGIRKYRTKDHAVLAFYERLYDHLNDHVVGSDFGGEFLGLVSVALRSTMLPSKLIAMFIKKLVSTACTTKCMESTTLLTIAINLLKRHSHTCLTLVHWDCSDGANQVHNLPSVEPFTRVRNRMPRNADLKSLFLWELPLLMNHFNERTARLAASFYSDLTKKRAIMLQDEHLIGCRGTEHLRQELAKARREGACTVRKTLQKTTELTVNVFL